MIELAIWVGTLLLLFIGLLIGLYVLRSIFYEAIERQRSGKPESPGDTGDSDAEAPGSASGAGEPGISAQAYPPAIHSDDEDATQDTVVCSACGTENEPSYTYCQECTQRL